MAVPVLHLRGDVGSHLAVVLAIGRRTGTLWDLPGPSPGRDHGGRREITIVDGRHRLDYAPFIGDQAIERILVKAKQLRVLHISSTFYGGGGAEMLSSSTCSPSGG